MCVVERARLDSMKRAVRELGIGVPKARSVNGTGEFLNGSLVNGVVHGVNGVNGASASASSLSPIPLSDPLVGQTRLDDITDEDIEEGPGNVEDTEDEGVILSNGEVAAQEVPPADELDLAQCELESAKMKGAV
jgi:hypothetical protein